MRLCHEWSLYECLQYSLKSLSAGEARERSSNSFSAPCEGKTVSGLKDRLQTPNLREGEVHHKADAGAISLEVHHIMRRGNMDLKDEDRRDKDSFVSNFFDMQKVGWCWHHTGDVRDLMIDPTGHQMRERERVNDSGQERSQT
jgi:hypothetical protein